MKSPASIRRLLRASADKSVDSKIILEFEGRFLEVEDVEPLQGPAVILHGRPIVPSVGRPKQLRLFPHQGNKRVVGEN